MKFFNNSNNATLLKRSNNNSKPRPYKYVNYLYLFNVIKLQKKFTLCLFDFLYYNSNYKSEKNKYVNVTSANVVPFLLKGGDSFKNSVLLFNLFAKFYKIAYNQVAYNKLDNYKYYKEFFYNFYRYNNYKNLNYLLSWIFSWVQPMFCVECTVVPKKYRKKLKKKYLYKVKYLNKNRRLSKALNWIIKYSDTIKNFNVLNRQLLVYLDLLLNYKNSYVYNKKILIYKKVFKL